MNAVWLRLLYIFEFLLAIPAIYTLWSQVGGQGHLDIMPWYWKLGLGMLACLSIVRATASAAEHEAAWNMRTRAWVAGIILIAGLMGGVTFYYHLHEAPDEVDSEETTTAVVFMQTLRCQPA